MNKLFFLFIISIFLFAGCKKGKIKKQGCSDAPVTTTFDGGYFAMANIFTPNDDGINDDLQIFADGLKTFKLTIKKGSKTVYETTDYHAYWGGAIEGERETALYKYEIEFTTENGQEFSLDGKVLSLLESDGDYCVNSDNKCAFGDQYIVRQGFTYPTNDPVATGTYCD